MKLAALDAWLELTIAASAKILQIIAVKKCFITLSVLHMIW